MSSFEDYAKEYLNRFEDNTISEAMKYSFDGGNRFRPKIIFSILKGFNIEEKRGYDAALALEFIQTYSLIHDDLPAMDNDDLRRGKPTCHKKFREDIAILAGDSLLTHAFGIIADSDYEDSIKVKMISALSKYAGMSGMILGQMYDVEDKLERNEESLFLVEDNKTSGLFKIACLFAMFIAGVDKYDYFLNLGSKIGVIFQLEDDLFDEIKSAEEFGKSTSDKDNNKFTALTIYSTDQLKEIIKEKYNELDDYLLSCSFNYIYLNELLDKIKNR